jgi:putative endonuclease
VFARLIFAAVNFAARKGLAAEVSPEDRKTEARRTGVRGETYAYWYLRRHHYTLVARNFTFPGTKGEIDIIGYDGAALVFVEVKTRTLSESTAALRAEDAVDREKRRNLRRIARQFLRLRRIDPSASRFDVLAIETQAGKRPNVRLHKAAFSLHEN